MGEEDLGELAAVAGVEFGVEWADPEDEVGGADGFFEFFFVEVPAVEVADDFVQRKAGSRSCGGGMAGRVAAAGMGGLAGRRRGCEAGGEKRDLKQMAWSSFGFLRRVKKRFPPSEPPSMVVGDEERSFRRGG